MEHDSARVYVCAYKCTSAQVRVKAFVKILGRDPESFNNLQTNRQQLDSMIKFKMAQEGVAFP